MAKPALSVVISTVDDPACVIARLDGLRRQVAETSSELLIVSGAAASSPPPPDVTVHHVAGGSVFDCRAAALKLASADVVALTEDHCVHPADWCTRIVQAFAARPELVMLGGAVANGSTRRLDDLMNYWTTFAPYAPGQVTARRPCIAQLAVRKSRIGMPLRPGELENRLYDRWAAVPGAVHIDPELVVLHVQSHGLLNTFAIHFHNGRTTGAFQRSADRGPVGVGAAARQSFRAGRSHYRRTLRSFEAGRLPWWSRRTHLLLVLPLMWCQAVGEFVGSRHGPGDSPRRLV